MPRRLDSSWIVYIVRCADGTLYTGITRDVARRIAEHNRKGGPGARYTRSRQPVKLVYLEAASGRSKASRREFEIKQLRRAAKLALVTGGSPRRRATVA